MSGAGVRLASLVMDWGRKPCNYQVDILADEEFDLASNWGEDVAHTHLSGVGMWTPGDFLNGRVNLNRYGRILLAAKLELFYDDRRGGVIQDVMGQISLLLASGVLAKNRISVLFDDNPFLRCRYQPDADVVCGNTEKTVRALADLAHEFIVLTTGDRHNFRVQADRLGIDVRLKVWPLQIRNMEQLLPTERFPSLMRPQEEDAKQYLAMIGNNHVVNRKMIQILFESGAVRDICAEIGARWSKVRLLFIGGITDLVQKYIDGDPGTTRCVEVRQGIMPESEFEDFIQPRIRAMLNPFFEDVNSGISVKTYEAIMSRVPFVTSIYGMHGLADEMEECRRFPIATHPSDPKVLTSFIIDKIVDKDGYLHLCKQFEEAFEACVDAQHRGFWTFDVCPNVRPLALSVKPLPLPT